MRPVPKTSSCYRAPTENANYATTSKCTIILKFYSTNKLIVKILGSGRKGWVPYEIKYRRGNLPGRQSLVNITFTLLKFILYLINLKI